MIRVIDNAIAEPLFKTIKDIVDGKDFPWYLGNDVNKDIDGNNIGDDVNGIQTKQLVHLLFSNPVVDSSHTAIIHKIIKPILEKNEIHGDIVKSKFNLLFPHHIVKNNIDHNVAHIDLEVPHYSIIYFLNDSDGDTVFFEDDNTEIQRVKPKENRMVIFDGMYHASSNPIKSSFRKVLNVVVKKYD